MNPSLNIRKLYSPLQPTLAQSANNVIYSEILPDLKLQPFVYCYWELKTQKMLDEQFYYRVVADGCIDVFFDLNNPTDSFVMGFCKTHTVFPLNNWFHYVGIRFLPTMFPQLFKINASELSNRFERLQTVIPSKAKFIAENFEAHQDTAQIKALIDSYFIGLLAKTDFHNDGRLYEAINIILENTGMLNIERDLDTGISPRQLRRLFEHYVGDTAKTFSKIVRFQNVLKARPKTQNPGGQDLLFDAGYYDQSHFIKEFKNLYGDTPAKAFST